MSRGRRAEGFRDPQIPLPIGAPEPAGGLDAGWQFEELAWAEGYVAAAGIDEVGRGALAGPVVAGAVIFEPGARVAGLRDSKLLTAERREALAPEIRGSAAAFGLAAVDAGAVDRLNVLEATLLAMSRAVAALGRPPDLLLLDAVRLPGTRIPQRQLVRGDRLCASIAAASILAKVERDRRMVEFDRAYPYYGFGQHKGYGTRAHLEALQEHGPSPVHRMSFLHKVAREERSSLF